jgi:hypothetical protein
MTLSNPNIIRYCSWAFILFYIIIYSFWIVPKSCILGGRGDVVGGDFLCFYAASHLLLSGHNVFGIYDGRDLFKVETQIAGMKYTIGWYYPPTFLLFISWLATLPYFLALFCWLAITLAGYILVVRKIAPHPYTVGLVLAFPATFHNIYHGQNGFLSALLLGQGLLLLEQRPKLAGLILGLLVYKPHLAALTVIALVAAGKWRALAAACASAGAVIMASIALYGMAGWESFYRIIPVVQHIMEIGQLPMIQMPTLFALARLLGASVPLAYGLQAVFATVAVIAIAWVWHKQVFPLAYIVLTICIFLATPYAYQYDLTITGLGIAWYGWEGVKNGWLPYEKAFLVLAWLMPLINTPIVHLIGIQIVPIVLSALLIMAIRRGKKTSIDLLKSTLAT